MLTACTKEMADQPRFETYEENPNFLDGRTAQPAPAGTVEYQSLEKKNAQRESAKAPLTLERLRRGRERFEIFCTECHGQTGEGNGIVVQRGYPAPPSYHTDRLRRAPVGYFVDVMTNGLRIMPSYSDKLSIQDRWAVEGYIRALQLSRNFPAAKLNAVDRQKLGAK